MEQNNENKDYGRTTEEVSDYISVPQPNGALPMTPHIKRKKNYPLVQIALAVSLILNGVLICQSVISRARDRKIALDTETPALSSVEFGPPYGFSNYLSANELIEIMPFMNSSDIGDVCRNLFDVNELTIEQFSEIVPFMNSSDIGDVCVDLASVNAFSIEQFSKIVPFMNSSDIVDVLNILYTESYDEDNDHIYLD